MVNQLRSGATLHLCFSKHTLRNTCAQQTQFALKRRFYLETGFWAIECQKKEVEVYMLNESHCERLRALWQSLVFWQLVSFLLRQPLGGLPIAEGIRLL